MRRAAPHPTLPPEPGSDRERIIELFANRQPSYTRPEILRLLALSEEEFEREIADLVYGPEQNDQGMTVFRWDDVAQLALERWTPRMIEAALHNECWTIPHLNQHRLIRVSLPSYLIRYLHHRAEQESTNRLPRNASDIIEDILYEHVDGENLQLLEMELPGLVQAMRYPYYIPRPDGVLHRCQYCDTSITEATRAICAACSKRHQPDEHLGEYGIPELEEPRQQPPTTKRSRRKA